MITPSNGQPSRYRFADLGLDVSQRRLTRSGQPIELGTLNFDLLRLLVESAPNVVPYDTLAEKVWGRHFVSPENIAQRVKLLRQALDDDAAEPRYIETVRNKGYRLIPPVQSTPDRPAAERRLRRPFAAATAALALVVVLGAAAYRLTDRSREVDVAPRAALPNSVAILPFTNLSATADANEAAFAAGLHAEVIGRLAQIPNVNVIAQTSVQRYADARESIAKIAAELNVEMVMQSSIRYSGERVRITPNLVDASTGTTRWSDVYDREVVDIFAIQEDIALKIAMALGAELSAAGRPHVREQLTTSSTAAALYVKAVGLELPRGETDSALQHRYLDEALELDPQFANAYALRASLYALAVVDRSDRGGGRAGSVDAALERAARDNARRALELDSQSPWAYLAMGDVDKFYWRWRDALRNYTTAHELAPNDTKVAGAYAWFVSELGRHQEAVAIMEHAARLNPASPATLWSLGIVLGQAGRPAEAATVLRQALDFAPSSAPIRHWLGQMEAASGNHAAALVELRALADSGGGNPTLITGLMYSFSRIGQADEVARLFGELQTAAAAGQVGAGTWALAYLARGDSDEALPWLEQAVEKIENHEPDAGYLNLLTIKMNMHRNPVLEEPRFRQLRDRIGALN